MEHYFMIGDIPIPFDVPSASRDEAEGLTVITNVDSNEPSNPNTNQTITRAIQNAVPVNTTASENLPDGAEHQRAENLSTNHGVNLELQLNNSSDIGNMSQQVLAHPAEDEIPLAQGSFDANIQGLEDGRYVIPHNSPMEEQEGGFDQDPYELMMGVNFAFEHAWRFPRAGAIVTLNPDILGESRAFWNRCILGFLVDTRLLSADTINDYIESHWAPRGIIRAYRMRDVYAFHCSDDNDMHDILARSTASFEGALMVFTRWEPEMVPRTIRFPFALIWVRVCGLPFEFLNLNVAEVVGPLIARQHSVEFFYGIPENDYLRIRVCLCLEEPLVPGFFLACIDGSLLWIQFRYEEIFVYCVRCGRVGHTVDTCVESSRDIAASVHESLTRITERGFVLFHSETDYSMFDLDLRALPLTTRHVTSRMVLGNHGISPPVDYQEEREVNLDIGNTYEGRAYPGMRFAVSSQPFSGPVLYPNGSRLEQRRHPMQTDRGESSRAVEERFQRLRRTGPNADLDAASDGNQQGEINRGYAGPIAFREHEEAFNENRVIHNAIRNRVTMDREQAYREDRIRGYNQLFEAPFPYPIIYHEPPFDMNAQIPIIREEEYNDRAANPDYVGHWNMEENSSDSSSNGSSMTFTTPEFPLFSSSFDSSHNSRYADATDDSVNKGTAVAGQEKDNETNHELTMGINGTGVCGGAAVFTQNLMGSKQQESNDNDTMEDELISLASSFDINDILQQILEDEEQREIQRKLEIKLGKRPMKEVVDLQEIAEGKTTAGHKVGKRKAATDLDVAVVPLKVLKSKETAMDYLFSLAQELFAKKAMAENNKREDATAGSNSGVFRMTVNMGMMDSSEESVGCDMEVDSVPNSNDSGNDNIGKNSSNANGGFAEVGPNQPPKPT